MIVHLLLSKSEKNLYFLKNKYSQLLFFLTAIWLPHGQLWPIIEGAGTLTVINHQEPRNEVGSLSRAKRLV